MQVSKELASGAILIESVTHCDARGDATEIDLVDAHVPFPVRELCMLSKPRVLRGIHFQDPRMAPLVKILTVEDGEIFEVLVNLRDGSVDHMCITGGSRCMLVIPPWTAHGHVVISDRPALLRYRFDSERVPAEERAILWSTLDVPWPIHDPVLNERDACAPGLQSVLEEFRPRA